MSAPTISTAPVTGDRARPVEHQMIGAVILAAGPWIVAVAALVIVGISLRPQIGLAALEDLRIAVVYAFMLAALAAAPAAVIATRSLALAPSTGAVLTIALCASGAGAITLALLVSFAFGLVGSAIWPGFLMLTSSSAMVLTAMPILAACRAEVRAVLSFLIGMGGAVVLSLTLFAADASGASVLWAFSAGNAVCLFICGVRYGAGAADPEALLDAARALRGATYISWPYALAAASAVSGVWIDKWIIWIGPTGGVTHSGFLHAPGYDGAMFLAHLSALPALTAIMAFQAGPVMRAMEGFHDRLNRGDTLASLETQARCISLLLWSGLFRIFGLQASIIAILVLMAPLIAEFAGFRLDQLLLLRIAFPAAFLHSLFLGMAAVLTLTNDNIRFALLHVIFLILNLVLTAWLSAQLGVTPLGFQIAGLLSIMIAAPLALSSMRFFVRRHFLEGNDSLFKGRYRTID